MLKRCSAKPYEGKENYIFISYCHRDKANVFPIIEQLVKDGYRVWYDEGIDPGSEWPEIIAQHLNDATICLAFISEKSLNSHNCRREVTFAVMKGKYFISVILEEVQMSLGMEMQLSAYQSIFKYKLGSDKAFFTKLYEAKAFQKCLGQPNYSIVVSKPSDYDCSEEGTDKARGSFNDKWFTSNEETVCAESDKPVAEEVARQEAEERARQEAEERARQEAEERARQEAEEKARQEAEEKARQEAEEAVRREAEEKARREAEEAARREAEEKARREAEEAARREAEERARREAEEAARREAEERACQEAEEAARRKAEKSVQRTKKISSYSEYYRRLEDLINWNGKKTLSEWQIKAFITDNYLDKDWNLTPADVESDMRTIVQKLRLDDEESERRRAEEIARRKVVEEERCKKEEIARAQRRGNSSVLHMLKYEKNNEIIQINQSQFVIGRSESKADYVISGNDKISRSHATINIIEGIGYITDNASLNKTFLNGRILKPEVRYQLQHGDSIEIYNERFIYVKV